LTKTQRQSMGVLSYYFELGLEQSFYMFWHGLNVYNYQKYGRDFKEAEAQAAECVIGNRARACSTFPKHLRP
jgi:hypothetical protein